MKAAVLERLNEPLNVTTVGLTPLQVGQVLVKVLASGICGAQLQEIRGEKGGPLPHLMGHEGCGIVEQVGPGVKKVSEGDKVIMHWRPSSGIESDFPKYFLDQKIITSGLVTTFSEKSICSENRLTKVPANTDTDLCCLLGCSLSTALATLEQERVALGEDVLIVGVGGLGLALLAGLALSTPSRVCACDVHEQKRRRVEIEGGEFVNLTHEHIEGKFDVIFDTAGNPGTMEDALMHLAPSGRYVMIGQPAPGKPVCLNSARHLFEGEGKTIRATQGGGFKPERDVSRYLKVAESLSIHNLITHRYPLEQVNVAIDLVRAGEAGRVILEMKA